MKRRACSVIAAVFLLLALSVPALAAAFPGAEIRDGDTYIGTFMMQDQTDLYKQFWDDWKHSNRNVCVSSAGGVVYYFFIIPEGATVTLRENSGNFFDLRVSKACDYLQFVSSEPDASKIEVVQMGTVAANTPITSMRYWVCGTYPMSFPSLSYDYQVSYTGQLYLEDDLTGEKPDDSGGILGWLASFWDKLLDFFIGLFVPHEGYFDDWFRELRQAFEDKLGGLGSVISEIKTALSGAKGDSGSLTIALPQNFLVSGSRAASVDLAVYLQPFLDFLRPLLTALIVLFTAIVCYKRLTGLANR